MPRDASMLNPKSELLLELRRVNERWFENRWRQINGPEYVKEFQFSKERKWRFDACWKDVMVALEIDGGGHKMFWSKYRNDIEKQNAAHFLGWQVFRITTDMVRKDDVEFLENLKIYLLKRTEQEGKG